MPVLFKVKSCEVELLGGLDILWQQCCLGGIWHGAQFVAFRLPLHQDFIVRGFCGEHAEAQVCPFGISCFYVSRHHFLGRHG